MSYLDRQQAKADREAYRRSELISKWVKSINEDVGLREEVLDAYKSDLANIPFDDYEAFKFKLADCILLLAESYADNELSRGE